MLKAFLRVGVPRKYFSCTKLAFRKFHTTVPSLIEIIPRTMKLTSTNFREILTPEIEIIKEIFIRHNYEIRIAGGAVRDLLLDKKPQDIDFATTATPEKMKEMFNSEGIRMINNRGESHGTITVRLNEKANYEITTLRIDVLTDGRHAQVEFTENWQLDSERRDLTVNSMFLGLDGTLYDYFNGYDDLKYKKTVFVGSADKRIKEDYLRIMRYFRFYGKIAVEANSHDSNTLSTIKENLGGLKGISGERIWSELYKILMGNHVTEIIETMIDLGMGPFLGMPENVNILEFRRVSSNGKKHDMHPMTILTSLFSSESELIALQKRLKFSNYDRDLALFILKNREASSHETDVHFYKSLIVTTPGKLNDIKVWTCELFKYKNNIDLIEEIKDWKVPRFPVSGHRLIEKGLKSSPKFKTVMAELKRIWIDSKFSYDEDKLLEYLPDILEAL